MAEAKKSIEPVFEEGTVSKADYDNLAMEYQKVVAAYNKAISIIANDYAEKVSKAIFDELNQQAQK